jgi:pseudouridylate synthase
VVVAAGTKALLDVPKTLEFLETLGVPVVCYRSDEFPAFWSRSSGLPAPIRLDDAVAIAAFVHARGALGQTGGILVANPIPAADEIPAGEMRPAIEAAVADAAREGITGKAVTPYLLGAILKKTGGRSLTANIALIKNNARLAAEIAAALAGQVRQNDGKRRLAVGYHGGSPDAGGDDSGDDDNSGEAAFHRQ